MKVFIHHSTTTIPTPFTQHNNLITLCGDHINGSSIHSFIHKYEPDTYYCDTYYAKH